MAVQERAHETQRSARASLNAQFFDFTIFILISFLNIKKSYLDLESPTLTPHEVLREDRFLARISAEKGQEIVTLRGRE